MASEETRRIIAEACAAADRACEQSEQFEMRQRSNAQTLVYKTFETPMPHQQPQQSATVWDGETERRWTAWCDGRIKLILEDYLDVIGEFVAQEQNKQDAALIKKLNEEVGALRADFEVIRAHAKGEIVDLPPVPLRKRNVA